MTFNDLQRHTSLNENFVSSYFYQKQLINECAFNGLWGHNSYNENFGSSNSILKWVLYSSSYLFYKDCCTRYHCDHCPYATVEKAALDKHRRFKHTNERPFMCDTCGFREAAYLILSFIYLTFQFSIPRILY